MSATYLVDGVPLDDPDGRWSLLEGTVFSTGSSRSVSNIAVPGMDGALPGRSSAASMPLVLKMDALGHTADGLARNLSAISSLLSASSMTVTRVLGGVESTASAQGESVSVPEYFPSALLARFTATLRLPVAVWRGRVADFAGDGQVTTLDGSTAPIDDALLLIDGPATDPVISCGDAWAKLTLTLGSGDAALIDCKTWTVRAGSGVTFAGGGDVKTGVLTTSGGPYLLRLVPRMVATDPAVTAVTVACSDGDLSVRAAPAWLA